MMEYATIAGAGHVRWRRGSSVDIRCAAALTVFANPLRFL